ELMRVISAVNKVLELNTQGKHIQIKTDSEALLAALGSKVVTSELVWQRHEMLEGLAAENSLELVWVKGHSGIEGNEVADRLAVEGTAEGSYVGPEPSLPLAWTAVKTLVRPTKTHQKMDIN